jgi:hypothetical protein
MNDIQNIFSSIPDDFPQERLQDILITDDFKVERIEEMGSSLLLTHDGRNVI